MVAELPRAVDEHVLRRLARERGVELAAFRHEGASLLVLGYANVGETAAARAVAELRAAYEAV
jgi:hypothetical protein